MAIASTACPEPDRIESDPELLALLGSLTLSVFSELGVSRFSKLLDAIAENETFHELTMID